MRFLKTLPFIISALLLAAHFLRTGNIVAVTFCLAAPILLLIAWPSGRRIAQLFLLAGAIEWIRTTYAIYEIRSTEGAPWIRMAVIMGCVALFTLLSAWPLQRVRPTSA